MSLTSSTERRDLSRRFWRSATGFWRGASRSKAWMLTLGLLAVILLQLLIQYRLNVWNKDLFNALEQKNIPGVASLALVFLPLALGGVVLNVLSVQGRMGIQRGWRNWLTQHLIGRWLDHGRYYQLNFLTGDHQNPEYRIAEDVRVATEAPVDFAFGIITAFLTALTFITVLWSVGGSIDFHLGDRDITIPGFLVIAAVVYAIVTTAAMLVVARSFVGIAEDKNQAEAELRYAATRLRENGESIALLGGEDEEHSGLTRSLNKVIESWRLMCGQYMRTTVISYSNFLLAPVVPLILCSPKYLNGTMSLGEMMQAAAAFVTVQQAFNWLVENYPKMADWSASVNRVSSLVMALDVLERAERPESTGRIARIEDDGKELRLQGVSVTLDDGTVVVDETEVSIAPGEKVLVVGESGAGKSTLIRALAGLWPWGEGRVMIPKSAKLFFMPQRPYVPVGTLKRAVAYPIAADEVSDDTILQALEDSGLPHLKERIHEDLPWERTLSGGEQQRLAFARLFVHRPDIIVMDEATSALDMVTQDRLMKGTIGALPDAIILSVGHRQELEAYHNRKLVLERRDEGAKLVKDEALSETGGSATAKVLSKLFRTPRFVSRPVR